MGAISHLSSLARREGGVGKDKETLIEEEEKIESEGENNSTSVFSHGGPRRLQHFYEAITGGIIYLRQDI